MKKLFLLFMICVSTFVNAQEKETENFKKTDEVLSEIVKKALLVAEKTGNFVIQQSPLILQEFYAWHLYSSIFYVLICLVISFLIFKLSKAISKSTEDDFEFYATNIFQIIPAVLFVFQVKNIFFILVAPKLYLIEYFIK